MQVDVATLPHPPDVVLFDLDGTVVDTRAGFTLSVNHTLEQFGRPPRAPEELWGYLGPPTQTTFATLLGESGPAVAEAVATYRAHYLEHGAQLAKLYAGVRELLQSLHGRTRLAIATSKEGITARELLSQLGVAPLFDVIRGPDSDAIDEPKQVTVAHALESLSATASVTAPVMVGDRHFDVEGARVHGVPTIGVLWGSGDIDELRSAGAAATARHPSEIPALLGL